MHSPIYPSKSSLDDEDDVPGPDGWLPAKITYTDEPPKLPKKRKSRPRHMDWPRIAKYANRVVRLRGRWPNAYAAAAEILETQKGLSIDQGTLYKGILKFFPEWFELESKE